MKKQSFKVSVLFLISITLFLLAGKKAESCGPYLNPDDYYAVFDNSMFNIPGLKPFFLSDNVFADQRDGTEESAQDNIKSWLEFLNNIPSADHLEKVIYKANYDEIRKLTECISSKKYDLLPKLFNENSFVKYLQSIESSEIVDYILFAKTCEPEVTIGLGWNEKRQDKELMNKLIEQGISQYQYAKNSFIKDRYAYQVIRLAHYSGQYEKTLDFYNKYFPEEKKMSLIQQWSLAHKAGALKEMGMIAEANITFARVFDKCLSRRRQSILSMDIMRDSILTETFKLCKSNTERVIVYTVSAYKDSYHSIESMNSIFHLEPESKYLELLLSREVTELERQILPTKANWNGQRPYLQEDEDASIRQSGNELYETVANIARSGKSRNQCLWNFAAGYIATLLNNIEEAKKFYFSAKQECPKENLSFLRRIQIAEIVAHVNGLKLIDKKAEEELTPDLKWLRQISLTQKFNARDALIYIMNTLAKKYWKQGDKVKASLCLGIRTDSEYLSRQYYLSYALNAFGYDIRSDYHQEPIDEISETISSRYEYDDWYKPDSEYRKKYSGLERFLIDNYMYTPPELSYIQAKSFIARGLFEKALEILGPSNSFHNDKTEKLPADPFIVHIIDCHDCDYNAASINRYTVYGFCLRMLELEKLAAKNTSKAAEYYYLLANGLYNKSYYGNSWIASSFRRTSSPWGYYEGFNPSFYDCSKAKQYYLRAMSLSTDRNFAAKCLYMASKCEMNAFYNTSESVKQDDESWENKPGYQKEENIPLQYRTLFKKLKLEYSDTKYYKEILKECKYFYNYVHK